MKKILLVKPVRIISFILSCLLFMGCAFNISAAIFLYDHNLLNADINTFSKKIYSYATEMTADDIVNYYYCYMNAQNDNSNSYYINELEIYNSKYDKNHCNVGFIVKDNTGKTILSNFMPDDILLEYTHVLHYPFQYITDGYGTQETTYFTDKDNSYFYETFPQEYTEAYSPEFTITTMTYSEIEEADISHTTETESDTPYTITIYVPENIDYSIKDTYYYFNKLIEFIVNYSYHAVSITVLMFIVGLALFIFSNISTLYYYKNSGSLSGIYKIPFDIYFIIFALLIVLTISISNRISVLISSSAATNDFLYYSIASCGIILCILQLIKYLYIIINTKKLSDNILIVKLINKLVDIVKTSVKSTNLIIKGILLFIILTITESVILGNVFHSITELIVFIVYKIIILIILLILIINTDTVVKGAKSIAEGKLDYKIKNKYLFGIFKEHTASLNSINEVINKAVDEKIKSESTKTELITNVSHDLKTPLTSIINYIDLLKNEKVDNPKAQEYIAVIDRQSQRLKKLTADIVDASKAATGSIDMHIEKTILNVLLNQAYGEYEDLMKQNSLYIECDIPDEEIYSNVDGRLLWRVFDNLLNNICKYSLPGTRVYISLSKTEQNAIITFKNISSEKLNITPDELSERFVRGDSSRNTEGSGLGLSIAKSLTELMQGTFNICIDGDLFKVILAFNIL